MISSISGGFAGQASVITESQDVTASASAGLNHGLSAAMLAGDLYFSDQDMQPGGVHPENSHSGQAAALAAVAAARGLNDRFGRDGRI